MTLAKVAGVPYVGDFFGPFAILSKLWCDMSLILQYDVAKSQCLEHLRGRISAFGKHNKKIYDNACERADFASRSRRRAIL